VPPAPVRAAGVLVALQAVAGAAFSAALVVRSGGTDLGTGAVLGEAGFFLVVAVAVAAVAAGLVRGRRWARTPALVVQLLLLPVVYSLLGPSRQVLLGLACGALVFATFMLLINERSRLWSMGLDPDDRRAR
jgi:Ca2+/Na+ antiporter